MFSRTGESGNNICQAVFDSSASVFIQAATLDDAPFTGSWQPAQPLSRLVGHDGSGTWHFRVSDEAVADTDRCEPSHCTCPAMSAKRRPSN